MPPAGDYKFRGKEARGTAWEEGRGFGVSGRDDKQERFDWAEFSRRLPTGKDEASEAARKKLFRVFDVCASDSNAPHPAQA